MEDVAENDLKSAVKPEAAARGLRGAGGYD